MKKIVLGVCLVFMAILARSQGTGTGLEKIEVEKYYISDAADAAAAANDGAGYNLPVGSTTYRVYADLAPGAKLVVVTGSPGHELRIATTTEFYNNALGGQTANDVRKADLRKNTLLLDSWVSIGAGSSGDYGVLKAEDTGTVPNDDGVLKNAHPDAGVPLTTADGLLAATAPNPPKVSNVGFDFSIFGDGTTNGNSLVSEGSWYVLGGAVGPTAPNRVLIGQFTTNGTFSFELNVDVETVDGLIENYVARNPEGEQISIPSLTYPGAVPVPPTTAITAPATGSIFTVGDLVVITADAADADGTVTKVDFFVNDVKIGEDVTSPYEFNWTSVTGSAKLKTVATDNDGLQGTSTEVTITVNPNAPPTVAITAPANNTTVDAGTPVTITADAADTDGTVAKVEFFVNGTKVGEDLTTPYAFTWTSVVGTANLTAVATDNKGLQATSAAVTITVNAGNVAPTATITAPAAGTSYITGDVVTITANATDADGTVAKVEFFVNGTKVGEDATAPYQFDWTSVAATTTSLTAVATDNVGAKGPSAAVSIIVKDNIAPTATITAPAAGTIVITGDAVNITADATDADGSVAKVEFFVNGTKVGEDATAPYQFSWTSAAAGTVSLTAVATDNRGLQGNSAAVSITVKDNVAPTVAITAPAAGTIVITGDAVNITANATDADGTVAKVEFFVNGTKVGEDATAPYQFSWTSVAAGTVSLTAVATDNRGLQGTSAAVSITVKDNVAPTVAITAPASGTSYNAGEVVAIAANADDIDGTVAKVDFFVNGTKVGEDATAPYQFSWTSVAAPTTSLTAVATDNRGKQTTSAVVSITVSSTNGAPTATITAPASSTTVTTGSVVAIKANATDADGTITKVEFFVNGTKVGEDVTAPYQYDWTSVQGTAVLTAVATDNGGLKGTSPAVTIEVKNNVAPTVSITSPANGAVIAVGSTVAIAATAADADGSVTKVEFFVNGTKIGEDVTAPYQVNWTAVAGTSNITAVATDNGGLQTTSAVVTVSGGNLSPVVNITSPAAGAVYTAGNVVSIKANASDPDGSVTKVEFFVNGIKVGEDATAPYQYDWTSVLGTGTATLTAIATDNLGLSKTSAPVVISIVSNVLPVVSITAPANGATVKAGTVVTITTSTFDADGTIAKVEFFVNGTKIGEDATAPFQFNWTSVAGTANLTVVATDNKGGKGTSSVVTITVVTNAAPVVSITSPVTNSTVKVGTSVAIKANASDPDGSVSLVEFFVNGVKVGQDASSPYQYNWTSTLGTKNLTAVATDNKGAKTTSAIVVLKVVANTAPVVSITSPANGSILSGAWYYTLKANASDADGSVAKVEFYVNGCKVGQDATAPYSVNAYLYWGFAVIKAVATDNNGAQSSSTVVVLVLPYFHKDANMDNEDDQTATVIEQSTRNNQFAVAAYPNPFTSDFTLDIKNASDVAVINVFDITGKLVFTQKHAPENGKFTLGNDLFDGIYTVQVISGTEVKTVKVIKQNN